MSCPDCGINSIVYCNNDCGSKICEKHGDYHEDDDGKYKKGHADRCGDFKKTKKYLKKKEKILNEELASDKYKC